jgi:hypothetical protein
MDITVTMKIVTHWCGSVYCVPNFINRHECPVCAGIKIKDKDERIERLVRSNRGLRSALKRKR